MLLSHVTSISYILCILIWIVTLCFFSPAQNPPICSHINSSENIVLYQDSERPETVEKGRGFETRQFSTETSWGILILDCHDSSGSCARLPLRGFFPLFLFDSWDPHAAGFSECMLVPRSKLHTGKCCHAHDGMLSFAMWVLTHKMGSCGHLTFCLLANASLEEAPPHGSASFVECMSGASSFPFTFRQNYCPTTSSFQLRNFPGFLTTGSPPIYWSLGVQPTLERFPALCDTFDTASPPYPDPSLLDTGVHFRFTDIC